MTLTQKLWNDEAGFVVSAELVLVSTVLVLAMVVGLSEVAHGVNEELEDVGSAFGALNQSYRYSSSHGHKGCAFGSKFEDDRDECDSQWDISCDAGPRREGGKGGRRHGGW